MDSRISSLLALALVGLVCVMAEAEEKKAAAKAGAEKAEDKASAEKPIRIGSYSFRLDGRPVRPWIVPVVGTAHDPRPGDVIGVGESFMILGEERDCVFDSEEGKLFLQGRAGRKLVWAKTDWTYEDDKKVVQDPFPEISDDAVRGLWGVHLKDPSPKENVLARIDAEKTFVELRTFSPAGKVLRLPALPRSIRGLAIDWMNGNVERDYSGLRECTALRFLRIEDQRPVDASALEKCYRLAYLDLSNIEIISPQSLSKLTCIRTLDLRYAKGIEAAGFALVMQDLTRILLDGTGVQDLSPLGDLPRLVCIEANGTRISSLPRNPFPALETLELMSAPVSEDEVKAFSRSHPKCRVRHGWEATLKDALGGVDRIRIRSGGTCHRNIDAEETLAEVKDSREIREFIDGIEIDESKSNFHCMCCGEPSFEFYHGESLVVTLGFHHGQSLRWPGGWIGDGMLRPRSATFLVDWLTKRGVKGPLSEREEKAERERQAKEFLSFFPLNARRIIEEAKGGEPGEGWEEAARAAWAGVAREMADPVKSAVAACRALGTVHEDWSGSDFAQQIVLACAEDIDGETYLAALKAIAGDRSALLGASRLAFYEGVLARVPEKERTETAVALAEVTVADGADDNKLLAIRRLSEVRDPRAAAFLRKVAAGKAGREVAKGSAFQEPGIRASAYLALARQKEKTIVPEIERNLAGRGFDRGEDRAALEVCLALLGDPKYIKAEHYKFFSGTIGHAALAAIERFGGREGMDVLFDAAMGHGFASVGEESVLVAERLTGQKWFLRRQHERASWHIKEARAWWKANREDFLRQHSASPGKD